MIDVDIYPVLQTIVAVELYNTWLFFLEKKLVIYVYYNDIKKKGTGHQIYCVTYQNYCHVKPC